MKKKKNTFHKRIMFNVDAVITEAPGPFFS
jgi:hypothetical protein